MSEFVGMRGIIGVFAPLHVTGLERRVQCVSYTDHGQVIGCTDLCHLFLTGVPVLQHSKQQYHRRLLWLIQAFLYQAFVGNAVLFILGVIDCKLNEDHIRRILKQFLLRPEQSQYRGGTAESGIDVLCFLSISKMFLKILIGTCCIAITPTCCHAFGNRTANKPDGHIAGFGSIHGSPDPAGIPNRYQGTVDQRSVRVGQGGGFCGGGYRCLTALLCRGAARYAACQQHGSRCQGNMILTHDFTLRFLILRQHPTRLVRCCRSVLL